jgi:alpha-tubulin suppressor-like RCC1 family protein
MRNGESLGKNFIWIYVLLALFVVTAASDGYGNSISQQVTNFLPLPVKSINDEDFDPGAIATSGLQVNYTVTEKPIDWYSGRNFSRVLGLQVSSILFLTEDGSLYGVGGSADGQLGLGSISSTDTLMRVGTDHWIKISSSGSSHVLGIQADSSLWGWGRNDFGQAGTGLSGADVKTPQQISTGKWIDIAVGENFSAAIRTDSTLWTWGQDYFGQLGDGQTGDGFFTAAPRQVGKDKWIMVAAGCSHTLALRADSTLWACGFGGYGSLGTGDNISRSFFTKIGNDKWLFIAAGKDESYGITIDGKLYSWGYNGDGELGTGTRTNENSPKIVGTDAWLYVAPGVKGGFCLGIKSDSSLWSWGVNSAGQLGLGDYYDYSDPQRVGDGKWLTVRAGYDYSIGIKSDSSFWGWGGETFSQNLADYQISVNIPSAFPGHMKLIGPILDQSITFRPFAVKVYGDEDFVPGATASSGLEMNYTSDNKSVAMIVNGKIHITGVGTTVIRANQSGGKGYAAAQEVEQTLTVGKRIQTIKFDTLVSKVYGDTDFNPGATVSSGLKVSYESDDSSIAKIIKGKIHITGTGSTMIRAYQNGNEIFKAAPEMERELIVNQKPQIITFKAISEKKFGDADFAPGAVASSGLKVSYTIDDTLVATIVNGLVHIKGTGIATIFANQDGDNNWESAPEEYQEIFINKSDQRITFAVMPVKTIGDMDFTPGTNASSGLAVDFTSDDESVATITEGKIHITGIGTTVIHANQEGDDNFSEAHEVTRILTVAPIGQRIIFEPLCTKTLGDSDFGSVNDTGKTLDPIEIPIAAKTWTLIRDPYQFAVSWRSILDSSKTSDSVLIGPYSLRDAAWLPPNMNDQIDQNQEYYVYNISNSNIKIRIPPIRNRLSFAKSSTAIKPSTFEWIVTGDSGRDYRNFFGIANGTSDGFDPGFDYPKPEITEKKGPFTWFESPELAKFAMYFQTDFKSFTNGGAVWDAKVGNLKANFVYSCKVNGLNMLPDSISCILMDKHTGKVADLRSGLYEFTAFQGERDRQFEIVMGTKNFINGYEKKFKIQTSKLAIANIYPNPVRSHATIKYTLPWTPKPLMVSVDVYDLQGRLVATLVHKQQIAGDYSISWDAKNRGGNVVATGMYILQLRADSHREMKNVQVITR